MIRFSGSDQQTQAGLSEYLGEFRADVAWTFLPDIKRGDGAFRVLTKSRSCNAIGALGT